MLWSLQFHRVESPERVVFGIPFSWSTWIPEGDAGLPMAHSLNGP